MSFKLEILTPFGLYKETDVDQINVKSTSGMLGILPHHFPLVATLEISKLEIIVNGNKEEYAIGGGVLNVGKEKTTLLLDSIESKEEIDLNRALESKTRAEKRLEEKNEQIDIDRAKLSLLRALNRIDIANN